MPYIWKMDGKCLIVEEPLIMLLHMILGFLVYHKCYTSSKTGNLYTVVMKLYFSYQLYGKLGMHPHFFFTKWDHILLTNFY